MSHVKDFYLDKDTERRLEDPATARSTLMAMFGGPDPFSRESMKHDSLEALDPPGRADRRWRCPSCKTEGLWHEVTAKECEQTTSTSEKGNR